MDAAQVERAYQLRLEGCTYAAIADALGIDRVGAYRAVQQAFDERQK